MPGYGGEAKGGQPRSSDDLSHAPSMPQGGVASPRSASRTRTSTSYSNTLPPSSPPPTKGIKTSVDKCVLKDEAEDSRYMSNNPNGGGSQDEGYKRSHKRSVSHGGIMIHRDCHDFGK